MEETARKTYRFLPRLTEESKGRPPSRSGDRINRGIGPVPPALKFESPPPAPSPRHQWIAGYWSWQGNQYVWIPGHWELPPGAITSVSLPSGNTRPAPGHSTKATGGPLTNPTPATSTSPPLHRYSRSSWNPLRHLRSSKSGHPSHFQAPFGLAATGIGMGKIIDGSTDAATGTPAESRR